MKKNLLSRAKKESTSTVIEELSGKEIAVIGIALKVPGADSPDEFWSNLCRGEEWIREAPSARTAAGGRRMSGEQPLRRGYLPEIDTFDSLFFRIPPKEADLMDPYQRLFLETAWSALEDAGYGGDRLKGSRTGVYVGSGHEHEYKHMLAAAGPELLSAAAAGNLPPVIASRISYLLDLKGPSLVVDTACSSSLMAVHLACQALLLRECDMAIAGGIQLILDPNAAQPQIGIESPSSRVRAFDEGADGTVRGEGVGAVLLKPLSRAVADNDPIYAVIKGSVSNQDGKSIGITSPNRAAQEQLLISAWERAGIHPSTLSYIEAHGTGTSIGDPIEVRAIQNAFRAYTDKMHFCAIGSLKPNIGHLYHAAGIMGLIKSALALHHEQLPPSIHFEKPNPQIDFVRSPVYVNAALTEWKQGEKVRRCGVSSFGMSGTNCHVVLEEAGAFRQVTPPSDAEDGPALLTLSARSLSSLKRLMDKYRLFLLTSHPLSFRDVCYTTNIGRGIYEYRLAIMARSQQELKDKLASLRYETFSGIGGDIGEGIWFGGSEAEKSVTWDGTNDALPSSAGGDLWEQAASQYICGRRVDWNALHAGQRRRVVPAPTYAFDKHRHWFAAAGERTSGDPADNKREYKEEEPVMKASNAEAEVTLAAVTDSVRGLIADISGYAPEAIGINSSFMELGMDSIMLVNARHAIKDRFGIDIPMRLFFEEMSTVAEVGRYIVSQSPNLAEAGITSGSVGDTAEQEAAIALEANLRPYSKSREEISIEQSLEGIGAGLEGIVHKQLDLMARQLTLLQTRAARIPGNPVPLTASPARDTGAEHDSNVIPEAKHRESSLRLVEASPQSRPYVPYQRLESAVKSGFTPAQQYYVDEFIKRYTKKTAKSQLHTQAFRSVAANNRNVAGFRPYWKDIVYQIVVDRAEGATITDIDGNNYIDLTMGFGVNLFGHHVSFINEAVEAALQKGMCIGPINEVAGQVATSLRNLTGMERAAFFNSGTEAVMVALRLARAATGKSKIAIFSGSYHGTFDGVLAMSAGLDGASSPIAPGIPRGMVDEVIVLNYDHPESLRIIEKHAGELAAVLVEPVQSRRPDIQPASFLKELRVLTAAHDIAFIFDEVITGFRVHPGGAQAWFGIEADMAVYGKVVGGGLPIGIVAGKPQYLDGIDGGMWSFGDLSFPPNEERRTFVAGTFCQHPLAMNASLAVLRRLQEEGPALQEELNKKTAMLADTLNSYFAEEQVPLQIVRFGSLFRFVQKGDLELFYYLLIEKGVYIWEGRNCFLSTAHTLQDVERVIAAVKDSIGELRNAGFLPPAPPTSPGGGGGQHKRSTALHSDGEFPLTEEQKQLWFASRSNADTGAAYVESVALRLNGEIDTAKLQAAISHAVQRHGMLRTCFAEDGSLYRTKPFEDTAPQCTLYEAEAQQTDDGELFLPAAMTTGFDLTSGPLVRFGLLREGEEGHYFVFQAHHLVADGWSMITILKEIAGRYTGQGNFLASDSVPFSAFAEWQRALPLEEQQQARAFWEARLSTPLPELVFPSAAGLGFEASHSGVRLRRTVNGHLTANLRAYSRSSGVSLFMLMLAAYNMLLSRISGLREVTVGIPVAGQLQMGSSSLIGQCVNLLPLSSKLPPMVNLPEYAVQVRGELLELMEHQRCSYADIVMTLVKEGQAVFPPVVHTLFNFDKPPELRFGMIETKLEPVSITDFKYPLSLNVLELERELILEWDVGGGVCGKDEADAWLEAYCRLLEAVVSDTAEQLGLYPTPRRTPMNISAKPGITGQNNAVSGYGFVADDEGNPCLPGVPGQLHSLPGAEADQSQPSDLAAVIGADGSIRLLGSMDRLVTFGGYRAHLDQIESVLNSSSQWPAAAVVLESDAMGRNRLVAYCEGTAGGQALSEETRRAHASAWLPERLIPSQWITVPGALPRNAQAVNYVVLTARYGGETADPGTFAPPVTDMERTLHRLWCETLKLQEVGIHDDFLAVGGHSLAATVIAARLQGELGGKIPLSLLFRHPTIAGLAEVLSREVPLTGQVSIPKAEAAECYPQSPPQRSIFAAQKLGGAGTAYNVTGLITVEGPLDVERLIQAANDLVNRHECLRTSFHLEEDEPVQRVASQAVMDIPVRTMDSSETEEGILGTVRPFDLEQAPLMRIECWREQTEAGRQYLLLDLHHLIADGLSANLLLNELIALYDARSLPEITRHMKDFTQWQLGRIGAGYMRESEKYWSRMLGEDIPRLDWKTDYPRPAVRCLEGDRYAFQLPAETLARIRPYAQAHGVTLYSYFLAAYYVLLSKYGGQEDIMVGTTVSGRLYPDLESIPGMFVNTIPVRGKIAADRRFSELVRDVQANALEAFEHQEYPLERWSSLRDQERDSSRNPLFDVSYVYQHEDLMLKPQAGGGAVFTAVEFKNRISKFDLTLEAIEGPEGIRFDLEYCTALFHPASVETLAGHLIAILEAVAAKADISISEIDLLPAGEKTQLLYEFNATAADSSPGKPVFTLFEEQVLRTPEAVAISCAGEELTYAELNARANNLAALLRAKGVKAEAAIGLVMRRSTALLAAILGIWKAGGCYVPIDPSYPKERISYILSDCKAQWVIADAAYEELSGFRGELLMTSEVLREENLSADNPEPAAGPNHLAYMIYTSGSTGKPKGVMVEHQGLTHYIWWADQQYVRGDVITFPLYSSISFDLTVTSMFTPLISGNRIIVYPEDVNVALERIVEEGEADIVKLTPSHLKLLSLYDTSRSRLQRFIVGGEALETSAAAEVACLFGPDVEIYNEYGPTETVVGCMIHKYEPDDTRGQVPIGWPIDNIRLYIADSAGRLQAKHLPGELYIAGAGVARGYFNRPELTREKFITGWLHEPGKVYRTGDLVRWLPDGGMAYLGRIDEQVKIRGHRIETGEIQNLLLDYPSIREAAVAAKESENGEKRLCAYYVSMEEVEARQLEGYLANHLPAYMLPAEYIRLERLPLSANGKVDYKKLPDPGGEQIHEPEPSIPESPAEAALLKVWRDILKSPNADREDSFMRLGGDSIKAIQIASRMKKQGYRLEVADVLRGKTVKLIAPLIVPIHAEAGRSTSGPMEGEVPLAPIQRWFFEQNFTAMNHWNQSITVTGTIRFNAQLVKETLKRLITHHDALRMTFTRQAEGIVQWCRPAGQPAFAFFCEDEGNPDHLAAVKARMTAEMHQNMDLENGPLVQIGLIRGDKADELMFVIHHLVVDAVSWRILLDDFYEVYTALDQAVEPELHASDSYRDYLLRIQEYIADGSWRQELNHWEAVSARPASSLSRDGKNGKVRDAEIASLHLTQDVTSSLLKTAAERYQGNTTALLLAALGSAMHAMGIPDGLWVNMEGHGREAFGGYADYAQTVGWFTSHYPVYVDTAAAKIPDRYAWRLHLELQRVPHSGAGYNALKYMLPEEDAARLNALGLQPEISFNYLGEMDDSRYQTLFRLAELPMHGTESQDAERSFAIVCNVLFTGGRMLVEFEYNRHQYSEEIIQHLLQGYLTGLEKIISAASVGTSLPAEDPEGFQLVPAAELAILLPDTPLRINKAYPLSPMQESMLFHYLRFPDSEAYLEQCVIYLQGNLDPERLKHSFQQTVERHDILRTFFAVKHLERPLQAVAGDWTLPFQFEDWTTSEDSSCRERLDHYVQQNREDRFDLLSGPPLRVVLIRTGEEDYCLIWSFHHILLDGWSVGLLLSELFDLYAKPEAVLRLAPASPYNEYIKWLEQREPSAAEAYWRTYLSGYRNKSLLPRTEEAGGVYSRGEISRILPEELRLGLQQLSAERSLTMNILVQAAWATVLQKLNGTEDILFGAVVSGRSPEVKEIDGMIGLFINTIPVRVKTAAGTFLEQALQLQRELLNKEPYSHLPLSSIQSASGGTVLDHILIFENYPLELRLPPGLDMVSYDWNEYTNYDFNLIVEPHEDFLIRFIYNRAVFHEEELEEWLDCLFTVLERINGNPEAAWQELVPDDDAANPDEGQGLITFHF